MPCNREQFCQPVKVQMCCGKADAMASSLDWGKKKKKGIWL